MLVMGCVLMVKLKLLMFDELSLGLVLLIIKEIFCIIVVLKEIGVVILLIEQNVCVVLQIFDFGYVLEIGEILFVGLSQELVVDFWVIEFYFGFGYKY